MGVLRNLRAFLLFKSQAYQAGCRLWPTDFGGKVPVVIASPCTQPMPSVVKSDEWQQSHVHVLAINGPGFDRRAGNAHCIHGRRLVCSQQTKCHLTVDHGCRQINLCRPSLAVPNERTAVEFRRPGPVSCNSTVLQIKLPRENSDNRLGRGLTGLLFDTPESFAKIPSQMVFVGGSHKPVRVFRSAWFAECCSITTENLI